MELEEIRKEIDKVDNEIISLLARRKSLSREVGRLKKTKNKPVFDKKREIELITQINEKAKELGLEEDFVVSLYDIILEDSKKEQEQM